MLVYVGCKQSKQPFSAPLKGTLNNKYLSFGNMTVPDCKKTHQLKSPIKRVTFGNEILRGGKSMVELASSF